MPKETKEKIKDRMLKTAARLWGYADVEVETSFDPIVKLLLDACAAEIEKVSGEMDASHARMIEKMVEVILPDALVGIRPSSGIIHCLPSDAEYTITPKKHFYTNKKILDSVSNTTETHTIHFSPIGKFKLTNVDITHTIIGNKLYQIKDAWFKDIIHQTDTENKKQSAMWIALDVKKNNTTLQNLTFYFDIRNAHQKETFYHYLRQAKIYLNNQELSTQTGMSDQEQFLQLNIEDVSDNLFQFNQKICNHLYSLYCKHYLHIIDNKNITDLITNNDTPSELIELFGEAILKEKIQQKVCWLKIEFASTITTELLENVFCNTNCIPVLNRKEHEISYKTQKYINVIPIDVKNLFFDIKAIKSSNSSHYHKRTLTTSAELAEGEAILRTSGVGRFDAREARDTIGYLLEIIRDETSTFAEIGGDAVMTKMKELNQIVSRLDEQMKRFQHKGTHCYVMLKPKKELETVFIEYWTCNGKLANDLRTGTKLIQENGTEIISNSIVLLTNTYGGKNKLNFEEKLNLFRKYLLSKDRVVTAEDIKIICLQQFDNHLLNVNVKKGVTIGQGTTQGYTRCIDVEIKLKPNALQPEEIEYLTHDLQIQLEQRSSTLFPYRIILL